MREAQRDATHIRSPTTPTYAHAINTPFSQNTFRHACRLPLHRIEGHHHRHPPQRPFATIADERGNVNTAPAACYASRSKRAERQQARAMLIGGYYGYYVATQSVARRCCLRRKVVDIAAAHVCRHTRVTGTPVASSSALRSLPPIQSIVRC